MLSGLFRFLGTCQHPASRILGSVSEHGRIEALTGSSVSMRHEVAIAAKESHFSSGCSPRTG